MSVYRTIGPLVCSICPDVFCIILFNTLQVEGEYDSESGEHEEEEMGRLVCV